MRIILSHYSDCEFAMQTHISLRLLHHFISFCFYVKFDTHFFYSFLNWFFFQFYPSILNWLRIRFHNVFRWCDPDIMIRVMCIKCFYLFQLSINHSEIQINSSLYCRKKAFHSVENNSSYRFNNKKRARSFLSEAPPHHHGESASCLLLDFPILPSYWFLLGLIIVYTQPPPPPPPQGLIALSHLST